MIPAAPAERFTTPRFRAALLGAHLITMLAMSTATSAAEPPPLPDFEPQDPARYGHQIAHHQDHCDRGWIDERARGTMTLFDADGDSVRRSFDRFVFERAEEGDKIIIRFAEPAEIKGVAALTFERPGTADDSWLYLPASKRVRRISGANNTASFQGTEFTYEDLGSLDAREYDWRFLEEADYPHDPEALPVYRLEATPTYDDTGYSRLVVSIHRRVWRQERVEFFDPSGRLLKTRYSRDWEQFQGRFWRARQIEMVNHQTGKRTVIDLTDQRLDLAQSTDPRSGKALRPLTEDLFTARSLQP